MTEPTQPADYSHYEPTKTGVPPIPIPPPPPNTRRPWWHIGVPALMVVALVALIIVPNIALSKQPVHTPATHIDPGATEAAQAGATQAAAETATASVPTPTPHPTIVVETPTSAPAPTVNQGYTASDIVAHMQAADSTVYVQSTGKSIWDFSHNDYYVTVYATSSVQFSGCPGMNCADTPYYGLWVYASPQDAESAWQQVSMDAITCTDTSPRAVGNIVACGPNEYEAEYAHGRCLLLNADAYSTYGQVVTQYCG